LTLNKIAVLQAAQGKLATTNAEAIVAIAKLGGYIP
jgi:hypothetical protein